MLHRHGDAQRDQAVRVGVEGHLQPRRIEVDLRAGADAAAKSECPPARGATDRNLAVGAGVMLGLRTQVGALRRN